MDITEDNLNGYLRRFLVDNPFDFFDAIYCINLEERTDRWESVCQAEFEKLGISDRIKFTDSLQLNQ